MFFAPQNLRESTVRTTHAYDVDKCMLLVADQCRTRTRNVPTMKKRQASKIIRQVLQQGRPVNLADERRASKSAIRSARGSNSDLLADRTSHELERLARMARRFDSARKRQEQSFNPSFKRAARSRTRRASVGAGAG